MKHFDTKRLCTIANDYLKKCNYQMAIIYYKCAAKNQEILPRYKLGLIHVELKNTCLAEKYFLDCNEIFIRNKADLSFLRSAYHELGKIYENMDLRSAYKFYYKATCGTNILWHLDSDDQYTVSSIQDDVNDDNLNAYISLGKFCMKTDVPSAFENLLKAYCYKQDENVEKLLKQLVDKLHIDEIQLKQHIISCKGNLKIFNSLLV